MVFKGPIVHVHGFHVIVLKLLFSVVLKETPNATVADQSSLLLMEKFTWYYFLPSFNTEMCFGEK